MQDPVRRLERLSRYLSTVAIREGISPRYERVLRQYHRVKREAERNEAAR